MLLNKNFCRAWKRGSITSIIKERAPQETTCGGLDRLDASYIAGLLVDGVRIRRSTIWTSTDIESHTGLGAVRQDR